MGSVDVDNPFHQASFYLEELKYAEGEEKVVKVHDASLQIELLFREADIDSMEPEEFWDALAHYGESWADNLGMLNPLVARSIFADGVMHGIAFAAGLRGRVPY